MVLKLFCVSLKREETSSRIQELQNHYITDKKTKTFLLLHGSGSEGPVLTVLTHRCVFS